MKHKLTRLTSLLLAFIMAFSMLLVPVQAAEFSDVQSNSWYSEAVDYVHEKGWMTGTSETTFAPDLEVTRGMIVTVLAKIAGADLTKYAEPAFTDTKAGVWYTNACAWAAAEGLVAGVGDGRFLPKQNITRQDLVTILYKFIRMHEWNIPADGDRTYNDMESVAAYALDAVNFCAASELVTGYSDGGFHPKDTATRAQLAVILKKMDVLAHGGALPTDPMPAQSFSGDAGEDMSVSVNAPEGALPENTVMDVTRVHDDAILASIKKAAGMKVVAATDISFKRDGSELEPNTAVDVQIMLDGLENLNNPTVLHYTDDGVVEFMNAEMISVTRGGQKAMSFSAKDFSIYVIVEHNDEEEARAEVNFYRDADSEPVKTYYVKNSDTEDEMKKFLVDPGIGNILDDGQIFNGWTIDAADANTNGEGENYDTANFGKNYSLTTKPYTIDGIRKYLAGREDFVEGTTVINIYPIIYKVYVVSYRDEKGITLASENAIMLPKQTQATYTVSQDYTVLSQEENFEGWIPQEISEGNTNVVNQSDKPYHMGDVITISGNVIFSDDISKGHWLVFEENGYGATYNAPVFVEQEEVTKEPDLEMTRPGYTFDGWWTGAPASEGGVPTGERFEFGKKISAYTVLYAKWDQVDTAKYTVVIWKQSVKGGEEYDYVTAVEMTGSTKIPVSPVTDADDVSCKVNDDTYSYEGFHLGEYDTEVMINPAGGTVVEVHFDRNEHTLEFQINQQEGYFEVSDPDWDAFADGSVTYYYRIAGTWNYQYIKIDEYLSMTDGNSYALHRESVNTTNGLNTSTSYYAQIGDTFYPIQYRGGYFSGSWQISIDNTWHEFSEYSSQVTGIYSISSANPTIYEYHAGGWTTIKSITALYQQSISDYFPIVGTNGTTYTGQRWDPVSSTPYNEVLVYIDIMPDADVTFHADNDNPGTKTIHYYVEALPNQTPTRTYNQKGFVEYKSVDARYNWFTEAEDYIELIGYKKGGGDGTPYPPEAFNSNGTKLNSVWNNSNARNVYCYYTREKYKISYFDGNYVDGNNRTLDIPNRGYFKESGELLYEDDITSYTTKGEQNYYEPTAPTGFVLEGWFLDKTCTQPFNSTKMPLNGIQVFAKWRQIEYRVFLKPNALINGVRDNSLNWGSDSQQTNFRISYNNKVSIPTGRRDNYEFIGWYTDEALTVPYNKDTRLTDTTVPEIPPYDKTVDKTDNAELEEYVENGETKTRNIPMDKWGLLKDGDPGINKDENRFWIDRKLVLYCKWSKVLDGALGIHVKYDANGGINAPNDGLLYKESAVAVAQPAATPADTTSSQFLYWVLQSYNTETGKFEDIEGSVVYPGQNFTVDLDLAEKVEEKENGQTVIVDGKIQYVYTIQLRAQYGPLEVEAPTHIIWYGNGGTLTGAPATALTDEYVYSDKTAVNDEIPIKPDLFKHPEGYVFLGWARLNEVGIVSYTTNEQNEKVIDHFDAPGDITDQLWLEFNVADNSHPENYFTVKNGDTAINVTHIGADEKEPYQIMVAVWSSSKYFYVFHSATSTIEAIKLTDNPVDLKSIVTPGYLYGGYYRNYSELDDTTVFNASFKAVHAADFKNVMSDVESYNGTKVTNNKNKRFWKSTDAYKTKAGDDPGTALNPQGSAVYFLKEVPDDYLQNKIVYVMDYHQNNKIIDIYQINVVDDALYSYMGYDINDKEQTGITYARTFTISSKDWGEPLTITPKTVNENLAENYGYLCIKQLGADFVASHTGGAYTAVPKWKTLDGVEVSQNPGTYILNNVPNQITFTPTLFREYDGTEKIYVKMNPNKDSNSPSWWGNDSYLVEANETKTTKNMAYFYVEAGDVAGHAWVELKPDTVENGENIFSAAVPAGFWSNVILVRVTKDCTEENYFTTLQDGETYHEGGWKYNQTGNIEIPLTDDNYLYNFYENGTASDWDKRNSN